MLQHSTHHRQGFQRALKELSGCHNQRTTGEGRLWDHWVQSQLRGGPSPVHRRYPFRQINLAPATPDHRFYGKRKQMGEGDGQVSPPRLKLQLLPLAEGDGRYPHLCKLLVGGDSGIKRGKKLPLEMLVYRIRIRIRTRKGKHHPGQEAILNVHLGRLHRRKQSQEEQVGTPDLQLPLAMLTYRTWKAKQHFDRLALLLALRRLSEGELLTSQER